MELDAEIVVPVIAPAEEMLAIVRAPDPEIVVPLIAPEEESEEAVIEVAAMVVQFNAPDDDSDVPEIAPEDDNDVTVRAPAVTSVAAPVHDPVMNPGLVPAVTRPFASTVTDV